MVVPNSNMFPKNGYKGGPGIVFSMYSYFFNIKYQITNGIDAANKNELKIINNISVRGLTFY